jgi:hypothetical protein
MNCANHPDRERVAFCQDCGKPLCQECIRTVGSSVYCEQSLAALLSGGGVPASGGQPSGTYTSSPTGGSYAYTGNAGGINYNVSGVPPPPPPGEPNPGLAALLGFIPGVGAMYNGQYAKGVVHLIVFAILVSLADDHGIFLLFVFGWVFYQVIEAHHTARARRDGTPLPNPFGLNDLGERLGFGKSWPGASAPFTAPTQPDTAPDPTAPPPTGTYAPPAGYSSQPSQPGTGWGSPYESFAPPIPPVPPFGTPAYPIDPNLPVPRNRFPAGAIWLIGLGCLFLIGNTNMFHGFPVHRIIPFLLIGVGVWMFVHKMTDTGSGLADDGTPAYRQRLFYAIRGSIWVLLVGVLFLLDSFNILSWDHSWPLFIIVAGLMAIFRKMSYTPAVPVYPYPYPAPPVTPPPAAATSSIVPSNQHDQEGS